MGGRTPTNFRNLVVHEGEFPSQEHAMAFGRWVHGTIFAADAELKRMAPDETHKEAIFRAHAAWVALRNAGVTTFIGSSWAATVLAGRGGDFSFDETLKYWSEANAWDMAANLQRLDGIPDASASLDAQAKADERTEKD